MFKNKYWIKGAVIAAIIPLIIIAIAYNIPNPVDGEHENPVKYCLFEIVYIPSIPFLAISGYILDKIPLVDIDDTNGLEYLSLLIILNYAILGAIVGLIIDLIRKKRKK